MTGPPAEPARRQLTYDVRIWKTRVVKGAKRTSYQVRWNVAGKVWYETFQTRALADSHESKLKVAAREGEAFDTSCGLPLSLVPGEPEEETKPVSWYEFACSYVDMKWPQVAPNSRRSIADALATATTPLLTADRGAPKPALVRKALYGWAFNAKLRETAPPAHLARTIAWLEQNTAPVTDLADPDTLHGVLNQFTRKQDGKPAAATVVARKRAVLHNLLAYAVDKKIFAINPMAASRWKSPKIAESIDRRRVVNPAQGQALLDAVAEQGPMGKHLEAFFGCIYHAGLRPGEVVILGESQIELPAKETDWGWFYLEGSAPSTGGAWNDTGQRREQRHLKHRAADEVRTVPISPALGRLLRKHIADHGTAPDGRLFRAESGDLVSDSVISRTWDKARQTALTSAEAESPLAERPYDLRHARLSTWLNAGVAPPQVAEWAGNSVPVLLRVYAKCLTDSEQSALKRLQQAEPDLTREPE
jgi:integrase